MRLLKGAAQKGLLVLAVQRVGICQGTWGGIPLSASDALAGHGARTALRLADHIEAFYLAV